MKMDPRIQLLIDEVRRTHIPLFNKPAHGADTAEAYCYGCEGLEFDCPVLAVADALEEEYAE
jgi:hypothetical protein